MVNRPGFGGSDPARADNRSRRRQPAGPARRQRIELEPSYRVPLIPFGDTSPGPMLASLCLRALRLRCQTAASAMIDDYLVCRQHWGFDPSEMRIPVIVWHGRGDWLVPLAHTLKLAALIPTSTARVDPTAGHFFYRDRLAEIVEGLLPTGSPPGCASYLVAA